MTTQIFTLPMSGKKGGRVQPVAAEDDVLAPGAAPAAGGQFVVPQVQISCSCVPP
jgi:hypothetical protein